MACALTISGVEVLASTGGFVTSVRVFGTSIECKVLDVTIKCADKSEKKGGVLVDFSTSPGLWEVILTGGGACRCDDEIYVHAACSDDSACFSEGWFMLDCGEPTDNDPCPTISNQITFGDCVNGNRQAIISGTAANLGTAAAEFKVEFSPGVFSALIPVPAGSSVPYSVTHDYPGGSTQTITFETTQPGACPPTTATFTVPPCGDVEELCPVISATYVIGDCTPAGLRPVEITYTVTNNTGGPAFVQLEFAPTIYGAANAVASGTAPSFTETHAYDPASGPATPVVRVSFPTGCSDFALPAIPLPACPGDGPGETDTCPDIDIDMSLGDCTAAGLRTVTFGISVTNNTGSAVVVEGEFEPGVTGSAQVIPDGPTVIFTEQYSYDPAGGLHVFRVNVLQPEGCPGASRSFFLKPCPAQTDCTEPTINIDEITDCAGAGSSASVTVSADMAGQNTTGCSFTWDSGIPGSTDVTTQNPTHTFIYSTPGTYAIGVIANCGECITQGTITVDVPSCCPTEFSSISPNVLGCVDASNSASVTGTVSPDIPGTYSWFVDGVLKTTGASGTSPAMTVTTSGNHTLAVEFVPDAPNGCDAITTNAPFSVPVCGGSNGGGSEGEGGGCIIGRWLGVIFFGAALALAALAVCLPVAATALGIAAAAALAVALIIFGLWAWLCDNKPCKWFLLFSWQAMLIAGLILILFMDCCPTGALVGAGMLAAAGALMATWAVQCKIGTCALMAEASVAVATAVIPLMNFVGNIPLLNACINPIAGTIVATLSGLLVAAVAACVASQD